MQLCQQEATSRALLLCSARSRDTSRRCTILRPTDRFSSRACSLLVGVLFLKAGPEGSSTRFITAESQEP